MKGIQSINPIASLGGIVPISDIDLVNQRKRSFIKITTPLSGNFKLETNQTLNWDSLNVSLVNIFIKGVSGGSKKYSKVDASLGTYVFQLNASDGFVANDLFNIRIESCVGVARDKVSGLNTIATIAIDALGSQTEGVAFDVEGDSNGAEVEISHRLASGGSWVSDGTATVVLGRYTKSVTITGAETYDIKVEDTTDTDGNAQQNDIVVASATKPYMIYTIDSAGVLYADAYTKGDANVVPEDTLAGMTGGVDTMYVHKENNIDHIIMVGAEILRWAKYDYTTKTLTSISSSSASMHSNRWCFREERILGIGSYNQAHQTQMWTLDYAHETWSRVSEGAYWINTRNDKEYPVGNGDLGFFINGRSTYSSSTYGTYEYDAGVFGKDDVTSHSTSHPNINGGGLFQFDTYSTRYIPIFRGAHINIYDLSISDFIQDAGSTKNFAVGCFYPNDYRQIADVVDGKSVALAAGGTTHSAATINMNTPIIIESTTANLKGSLSNYFPTYCRYQKELAVTYNIDGSDNWLIFCDENLANVIYAPIIQDVVAMVMSLNGVI